MKSPQSRSVGECARLTCLLEVNARKTGNVHPGADFEDVTYQDFVESASAIAPAMEGARRNGVGQTVLEAVKATLAKVQTNTNLGMVLLLAPLAAVPAGRELSEGVQAVLSELTVRDAELVYEAIRLAHPGGLGQVKEEDVSHRPTRTLLEAMRLAAGRDLVARQYANGYSEIFEFGLPRFADGLGHGLSMENAIIKLHLQFMAEFPDTLIARKRGQAEAEESARRSQAVLDAGWPDRAEGQRLFHELDAWLRAFGRQRNPGTSADLVTAVLFVALRGGMPEVRGMRYEV